MTHDTRKNIFVFKYICQWFLPTNHRRRIVSKCSTPAGQAYHWCPERYSYHLGCFWSILSNTLPSWWANSFHRSRLYLLRTILGLDFLVIFLKKCSFHLFLQTLCLTFLLYATGSQYRTHSIYYVCIEQLETIKSLVFKSIWYSMWYCIRYWMQYST